MTPLRGPAVPRRRLGAELRRLREDAGLLIEQVAERLECSTSKISRLETGKGIPKVRDVRDMLNMYGVSDVKVRDRLLRLSREGQQQGWWHDFSDVLDATHEAFVAMEADAASMRGYENTVIHGLLQTPDYTRKIAEVVLTDPAPADIELFVELRQHRQEVLWRPDGPLELHVVMEEPALFRPVGGADVMREQLGRIIELARRPNITVQVLPLSVGVHPAVTGSFELLAFADESDHDVVYVERVGGAVILEHAKDVATYLRAFDELSRRALDPDASVERIASILKGSN